MITQHDQNQLKQKGIAVEQLEKQLNDFKTGFPFLKLEAAAAIPIPNPQSPIPNPQSPIKSADLINE